MGGLGTLGGLGPMGGLGGLGGLRPMGGLPDRPFGRSGLGVGGLGGRGLAFDRASNLRSPMLGPRLLTNEPFGLGGQRRHGMMSPLASRENLLGGRASLLPDGLWVGMRSQPASLRSPAGSVRGMELARFPGRASNYRAPYVEDWESEFEAEMERLEIMDYIDRADNIPFGYEDY